ncbi:hypothetical protein GCM10009127_24560 [Alteraurantiacibacter aestuarii]|uniref:energy transducer TonB n=1 Tax=Alteraurantiacibacter aestuarii TaxID=650004 RepID=UPI0031D0F75D
MPYLDTQHVHKRLAGVTGVALIHIALAIGLAAGLTVNAFKEPEGPRLEIFDIPSPVPIPPDDTPPSDDLEPTDDFYTPPVAPIPNVDLGTKPPIDFTTIIPRNREVVRIPVPPLPPIPAGPPTPAFTPRGPAPANGPAGWVTTNDYPLRALQRGMEGTVQYALDVGADGRVDNCRILSSTGERVLDDATCRWVSRRARFDPAIDSNGAQIAGSYRGTVTWIIPED